MERGLFLKSKWHSIIKQVKENFPLADYDGRIFLEQEETRDPQADPGSGRSEGFSYANGEVIVIQVKFIVINLEFVGRINISQHQLGSIRREGNGHIQAQ